MKKLIWILIFCLLPGVWGQETIDDQDFDNSLNQMGAESQDLMEDLDKNEPPADSLLNAEYIKNIMSDKVRSMLMDYLKENPFSKMSKAEVENLILSQIQGKPAEKFVQNFPQVFNTFVAWVRDPSAIPALLSIVNRPRVVKNYSIAVIVIFILSFALNLLNTQGSLLARIFRKLMIMVGAMGVNLILFYIFFKPEITPTLKVIGQNLF